MMFGLDGRGPTSARTGKPFIAWSGGRWNAGDEALRAVDAYLPGEWYRVVVERFDTRFTLEISGRFRFGGETTYRATLDAAERRLWHFNRSAAEDASACVDESPLPELGLAAPAPG